MVGVGSGVSVAVSGVGVARIASNWAQDEMNNVIARVTARSNLKLFRAEELCPRNDEVGEDENIIGIL